MRWYERPSRPLIKARPYRCVACGRRYWARPFSAHAKGQTTAERGPVFADRQGQELERRNGDAERIVPTDRFELQTAIDIDDEEPARAVTLEDIVKLSQAGIGESVLIEMDEIACPIAPSRLNALKRAGTSDQVLLVLLRNSCADGDRPAAARRPRWSEDESIDRVPHEAARSVRAGDHAHRAGAVPVPTQPTGAGARATDLLRVGRE